LVAANGWFFDPIVAHAMTYKPLLAALVRTTTAVTMIGMPIRSGYPSYHSSLAFVALVDDDLDDNDVDGGIKENVLPPKAHAIVNHRIIPGESVTSVVEHDRKVINDQRVIVSLEKGYVP
jgi:carboxypeptidase PM20D1